MENLSEKTKNQELTELEKGPPNSFSDVYIKNEWGSPITDVKFTHRYEDKRHDDVNLDRIENNERIFALIAAYWTGVGRIGKDYWWIKFKDERSTWLCKANFFCFLTAKDAKSSKPVEIVIKKYKMEISPPVSSGCTVSLYQED